MNYVTVTSEDQPDTYLVYYMMPGRNTLVASRSQSGGRDRFGSKYPAGDWCADGYELRFAGYLRIGAQPGSLHLSPSCPGSVLLTRGCGTADSRITSLDG
jgi:hypothetical protein